MWKEVITIMGLTACLTHPESIKPHGLEFSYVTQAIIVPFLVHFRIFCSMKKKKKRCSSHRMIGPYYKWATPQRDLQSLGQVGKTNFQNQPSLTTHNEDGAFRNKLLCSIQPEVPRPGLHNKDCGHWKEILSPSGVVNIVASLFHGSEEYIINCWKGDLNSYFQWGLSSNGELTVILQNLKIPINSNSVLLMEIFTSLIIRTTQKLLWCFRYRKSVRNETYYLKKMPKYTLSFRWYFGLKEILREEKM